MDLWENESKMADAAVRIVCFLVCLTGAVKTNRNYEIRTGKKSNIVFILTDDQDMVLGGMVSDQ